MNESNNSVAEYILQLQEENKILHNNMANEEILRAQLAQLEEEAVALRVCKDNLEIVREQIAGAVEALKKIAGVTPYESAPGYVVALNIIKQDAADALAKIGGE